MAERRRVQAISQIEPAVLPSSHAKIEAAFSAFDEYLEPSALMAGFEQVAVKLTPARFVHALRQRCAANPQRIVLPEANDHRVLAAAAAAAAKGLADVILLGSEEIVRQVCCTLRTAIPPPPPVLPRRDVCTILTPGVPPWGSVHPPTPPARCGKAYPSARPRLI